MDYLDDRALVRQRRRRAFQADASSRSVEHASNRPPVTDEASCRTEGAALPFGRGERFQRVARSHQARLGFGRTGSAWKRSDSGGETDDVEPLALKAFGGALEPRLGFGAEQLLLQHRGLFDLLEARAAARSAY